ncbi:kinase-like protein [Exidia glandulosa HHB12029]|uniref:non-specific serine/threonine protein kinase n=1 Tax=Exidia glandulosa HHB12029 TaxID=1314781 RepID=A0A165ZHH0_EXIGL|nr:kinase-like protein [Exidia glandulosa HHB12029]
MILTARSASPTSTASPTTLAQLSRNASVISSSSSSSSSSSVNVLATPTRERPHRAFSPPRIRKGSRDHSIEPPRKDPLEAAAAIAAVRPKPRIVLPTGGSRPADNGPPTPRPRGAPPRQLLTKADFELGDTLGEGSYSEVVSATHKATGKAYAIKVISKMHLIKKDKVKYATSERDALALLTNGGHPGIIQLFWTFQDTSSLYFVTSLEPNGNLQTLVRRLGSLSLTCAQYYTAQLVDTVTWMHERGVIHRDLKPENVLLDSAWRIKLADFGSAKLLRRGQDGAFVEDRETSHSFVGSPQYVSPELLLDQYKYACKSSDLYAVGCILFQLLTGQFLFHAITEFLTFQKIKRGEHTPFPDWFDASARDLIERLLPLDPAERIGAAPKSSADELKAHAFFSAARQGLDPVNWAELWSVPAPSIEAGMIKKDPVPEDDGRGEWDEFDGGWSRTPQAEEGESAIVSDEEDSTPPVQRTRSSSSLWKKQDESERHDAAVAEAAQRMELVKMKDFEPEHGMMHLKKPARSGSTSHSSDGTASSLDHGSPYHTSAHSAHGAIPPDQLARLLGPGEIVAHATRVHIRRDVLGGLVRKDRSVTLCLTSSPSAGARLVALHASRKGWRTEAVLAFAGGEAETGGEESPAATVLGVDGTPGDKSFTVRTASRSYVIVAADAHVAARWTELVRGAFVAAQART